MSSLVPGPLFPTPGLNRYSVPARVGSTSAQINQAHQRERFNGQPWPRESPVARVYDIVNTTTRLILLNNKKSRKYCHLRGHSSMDIDRIPGPEPDRHFTGVTYVNKELHVECCKSESPRFTPTQTRREWSNELCRPPTTFSNGSLVNPRHHETCLGHSGHSGFYTPVTPSSSRRPRQTRLTKPPECYLQLKLDDSGLTKGQRSYLWSISKVYSSENLRRQQQQQYFDLLRAEIRKGGHQNTLLYKYARYLESPRKTRCGKDERIQRVKSAPLQQQQQQKLSVEKSQNQRCASSTSKLLNGRRTGAPKSFESCDTGTESSIQSDSSISIENFKHISREGTLRPKSRIGRPKSKTSVQKTESQKAVTEEKEPTSDGKDKKDGRMSQQKIEEVNDNSKPRKNSTKLSDNVVKSAQTVKDESEGNKNGSDQVSFNQSSSKNFKNSTDDVSASTVNEEDKGKTLKAEEGSQKSKMSSSESDKAYNLNKSDNSSFENKKIVPAEKLGKVESVEKSNSEITRQESDQSMQNKNAGENSVEEVRRWSVDSEEFEAVDPELLEY